MAANSVTSAQAGTAIVTGAGSIKALAVTVPLAANAEARVPLTMIDAATAAAQGTTLYSAYLSDLTSFLYATKPTSVPVTPGGPTAPPAGTLMTGPATIPFTAGLFVKSCPANVTFTVTT
jgi:hypothetical protein